MLHRVERRVENLAATLMLVVLLAFALPGGLLAEEEPPPPPAEPPLDLTLELLPVVDTLFAGAAANDRTALDTSTCLEDLLAARLRREAALGMVADPEDPALVAERQRQLRVNLRRFILQLSDRGRQVARLDTSRVRVFAAGGGGGGQGGGGGGGQGGGGGGETLVGASGEALAITAEGLVGLEMDGLERSIDLSVVRLGERWCLDPLSME